MKKAIVYKTTNKLNGYIYVGVHLICKDEYKCSYLGSGVKFLNSVKKNGKSNYSREILYEFDSLDEAYEKEKDIVNKDFLSAGNVYNIKEGGRHNNLSAEIKEKISKTLLGRKLTDSHKENIRKNGIFTTGLPLECYQKSRMKNIGQKRTELQKQRMRLAQQKRRAAVLTNENN